MIVVLGYNNNETRFLNEIFNEFGTAYKYSLLENDITGAKKIILPHPLNLNSTYRRMNLMNLFSLLRIIKTPILGINDGFRLMCNQLLNRYKKGLGFFNFDILCNEGDTEDMELVTGNIQHISSSKLLDRSYDESKFIFYSEMQPQLNEFTTVKINYGDKDFSMLYEYENYYALIADSSHNKEISCNVISNFVKI